MPIQGPRRDQRAGNGSRASDDQCGNSSPDTSTHKVYDVKFFKRPRRAVRALSVLAFPLVAHAQTASLSLSPASGTPGSTINLPLAYASNGAQASGLQWSFTFSPSDFSGVSVAAGPSASGAGKAITCNAPSSGQYICLVSGLNANAIADGTLAVATFTVSNTTTSTSSAIRLVSPVAVSGSGTAIAATGSGTTVTINPTSVSPSLSALSCSPTTVTAPGPSQCTVALSGPAPSAATVSIGWTSTAATVLAPSSVTVGAGATSAGFTVQISSATASTSVQVTASLSSVTKTVTISVTPTTTVGVAISPTTAALAPGGTQQFTATMTGSSNNPVTWSLSSPIGSISEAGLYTAPASVATQQTVTVLATSVADPTKSAGASVIINPTPLGPTTAVSFWSPTATPGTASDPDSSSTELGLGFSTSVAGSVAGVRFYKGPSNTGIHVGHLWTSTGTLLASVTFTNETASGWQQANFSTPVTINADTVYVISYLAPNGGYADDQNYPWSTLSATPLSVSGATPGVYAYGSGPAFPASTWNASNYWVDVVFNPATAPTSPITVSISPSSVTLGPGGTQQFSATVSGTSNTAVTWSLSSPVGSVSTTGLYTAPSSVNAPQTVTVLATSAADATKYATASVVINPPITFSSVSFWSTRTLPGTASEPDTPSVELGLTFSSSVAGSVSGVRFYKGPSNTGTHVGHLWSSTGQLLASVTFTNETASGWQQANFSTPVNIAANTVYVISYLAPNGGYSDDLNYAWGTLSAAPLSVSGTAPGVFAYSATAAFPTSAWNGSNYWVDVVFTPAQ